MTTFYCSPFNQSNIMKGLFTAILIGLSLFLPQSAYAYKLPLTNLEDTAAIKLSFLENSHDTRMGLPLSVNPDFACVRLGFDNALSKNMVGQNIGLVKLKT